MHEQRRISVLGSTGSIGLNTLDLVTRHSDRFKVVALTAGQNVDLLAEQARAVDAEIAVIADPALHEQLADALGGTGIRSASGPEALVDAARESADVIMAAIVGAAGLRPTLAAVEQGGIVALANKECLVCAGDLFMAAVAHHGTTLIPVDSEHSAIFQVFDASQHGLVDRIILTASGGPFRDWTWEQMAKATPEQAVAHPNWSMGSKISVDSATMMNKGLELIETKHLFPVPEERIEILVHPQSVVHSLVDYVDGSVLAQLGTPDMRTPISYALAWPQRMAVPCDRLNLAELSTLTFEAHDSKRFPALKLARQALQEGGAAPTILNAANEVAVARFLGGSIGFLDIVAAVEDALNSVHSSMPDSLDAVLEIDANARRHTEAWTAC
jgi:1-deoxy-D-xylulose-5-phosphate reductoisomerase